MKLETYDSIREFRKHLINDVSLNPLKLNQFHDEIMHKVIRIAIKNITAKHGPIPIPFSFFVMGSAARFEQAIWSDQDHGIIYQDTDKDVQQYFLLLGKEISDGLYLTGYQYCDGGVMAGNPFWCKSFSNWQNQLSGWIQESSWESIRNLLIFIDSRSLFGENEYIRQLKKIVFDLIHKEHLMVRIMNNTMNLQKGIGVLGQILPEIHGTYSGTLNLKDKALFPYINAVRLLAIKESILEPSTLTRLDRISEQCIPFHEKEKYKQHFNMLLNYRLQFGNHSDYISGHYLPINNLNKEQKKDVKNILKTGLSLYQFARKIIEKEGSQWE